MTFDRLVFWSGIWNIGLGLILVTPRPRNCSECKFPILLALDRRGISLVLVSDSDCEFSRRGTIRIHHLLERYCVFSR